MHPSPRAEAGAPAHTPPAADPHESGAAKKPGNARRGVTITLTCTQCGTVSQIGIDRLNRKFQCRKCRRVYSVQPDGQLNELVRPQTRAERLRALTQKRLRHVRAAAVLLVVLGSAWYGWRTFLSAGSMSALPDELETRAQMLVKAWVNQDADTVQLLTTPEQESQVDTWLRANRFPLSLEELKVSRTWIHQTKIDVQVLKEKRDHAQLRILVSTPVSSPVKLEQQWVRVGKGWYFQPFPVYRGNVVVTGPPPVTPARVRPPLSLRWLQPSTRLDRCDGPRLAASAIVPSSRPRYSPGHVYRGQGTCRCEADKERLDGSPRHPAEPGDADEGSGSRKPPSTPRPQPSTPPLADTQPGTFALPEMSGSTPAGMLAGLNLSAEFLYVFPHQDNLATAVVSSVKGAADGSVESLSWGGTPGIRVGSSYQSARLLPGTWVRSSLISMPRSNVPLIASPRRHACRRSYVEPGSEQRDRGRRRRRVELHVARPGGGPGVAS